MKFYSENLSVNVFDTYFSFLNLEGNKIKNFVKEEENFNINGSIKN